MRYEPFELKGLKLEKEYGSTFPVLIQLVQNTKESIDELVDNINHMRYLGLKD